MDWVLLLTHFSMKKSGNRQQTAAATERAMKWLGVYFGAYFGVGFGYPLFYGESIFETFSKQMGWKKEGDAKIDCQSYYDDGGNKK